MNYPKPRIEYPANDLKLGIKSSLPNAAQAIVLAYLIWKCSGEKSEIKYCVQNSDRIILEPNLQEKIAEFLKNNVSSFDEASLKSDILENQLLKAQIEPLIVGFELIWKLAKFNFIDKTLPYSAERTGGKRYEKIISYTSNIDVIDLLVQSNEREYVELFYEILTNATPSNNLIFNSFRKLITTFSETAVYKIKSNAGDLIFNNIGIYKSLLEDSIVNLSDVEENKGTSRILKSSITEKLNYYLFAKNGDFIKNPELTDEELKNYELRVENFLSLMQAKVSFNDKNQTKSDEKTSDISRAPNNFSPVQTILYGVPGSGKSYSIKRQLSTQKISAENTVRVVFHPEYTNSDFVGQILPKLKKDENGENVIDYQFTAGPFTKILREAYCNPDKNYALIIEEINRGNAAAIFGELFQLLDRLDEDETEPFSDVTYTKGWSSYGVSNDCINAYLRGLYDDENSETETPCIQFDSRSAIRLPANLSLFATMNTSDQNVFSMDNAFKRRWNLKLIPNKFVFDSNDKEENKKQLAQCFAVVEDFGFIWGAFVEELNKKIRNEQSGNDISSFDDKQIGMWFVKAEKQNDNYVIPKEVFLNKGVEYLLDDVFKLEPAVLFTANSLNEILEKAQENPLSIFVDSFITSVQAQQAELENLKENIGNIQQQGEKTENRGKRINFSELKIPVGSELKMSYRGDEYTCTVINDTKVKMNGKEYSTLTEATKKIMGTPNEKSPGSVSERWSFEGQTLKELGNFDDD